MTTNIQYLDLAQELLQMLEADQKEWREFARQKHYIQENAGLEKANEVLRGRVGDRADRMLGILKVIGEPSLKNIGPDGALAMSVLATHASLKATKTVLKAFNKLYAVDPLSVRKESIPTMTDWLAVLERKQQRFGTIWLLDETSYPYLPTVEDFENVNVRRNKYGIEPLRWPKSLAISVEEQPWLSKPLSELIMRDPNEAEYAEQCKDYLI